MNQRRDQHGVETDHAWGMTEMSPLGTFVALSPEASALACRPARIVRASRAVRCSASSRVVGEAGAELPRDGKSLRPAQGARTLRRLELFQARGQ